MSDERLREAERRWKESGSVEDEARYLLERVRVGDLTRERLELAAYCGHEGARRSAECTDSADTAPDLVAFLLAIQQRSPRDFIQGCLVVGEYLEPFWSAGPNPDESFRSTTRAIAMSVEGGSDSLSALKEILADDRLASEMAEAGPRAPSAGALEFVRLIGMLTISEIESRPGPTIPMRAIARAALKCAPAKQFREWLCEAVRAWALRRTLDTSL